MEFTARNAATGEILEPVFRDATADEIDRVCGAAGAAFEPYGTLPPERRVELLTAIAEGLIAASDRLLPRAHAETGLPMARLENERNRTVTQLQLMASLVREGSWVDARIDTALPDRKPAPRPDLRRMLRPLGPVAVFGASNFPLAYSVAGGDTASALAAGNPVVVKAHPAHPGTSGITAEVVRDAVARCHLPAGVFGMVHGASPEVSLGVVRHPAIAAVGFTGSLTAGRALFDAAAARPIPIPVFSEMGSVNPVFVLAGELRERGAAIAEGLVSSFTLGVGQFCTKPGLAFGVASAEWDTFCEEVARRSRQVPQGVMLHAGIADAFSRGCANLTDVEWLCQGAARVARVDAAAFRARPELAHEIFGPYTLLVTVDNAAGLVDIARDLEGQLTASVHGTTEDLAAAADLLAVLPRKVGRVICNGFPTGVEVAPSMNHGGPYPATTDSRFTAVGTAAILRFARPVCYQGFPDARLPDELKDTNPLGLLRLVDGALTKAAVTRPVA
jgi:NADP-dependent aldehyde dehydrogenase